MRSIQFRVWTGKEMLYQDKQYLASFIRRIVPKIILDHGGEAFSQHESYLPNGGVIDEYLQQFTGLRDKDGIDIYEGDILKLEGTAIGWVEYDAEAGAYRVQSHTFWHHLFQIADREVIGNVYQHPELTR